MVAGIVVRIILRLFIRTAATEFLRRGKGNDAVVQGLGMIIAGGALAAVSFLVFFPIVFGSLYIFAFDAVLCLALVGGGIGRLVIGLFTFRESVESRSGPAESPVNYYVALPEEMPDGYCWQCGKQVKHDSPICLRCGATHPKGAQRRAMMSAPTLDREDSGQWPVWQEEEEENPLQRLGPGPMGPGRVPGGGPYPPGAPFPPGGPYPPRGPHPPQNMPYPGPGFPPHSLPSQPMRRPPPGGPYPGAPFPPNQQQPGRGRPPRGRPPRERAPQERSPRERKPSRPRWGR